MISATLATGLMKAIIVSTTVAINFSLMCATTASGMKMIKELKGGK